MNASERSAIGRPCKLDPDRARRIVAAVARGNTYETAARAAGIGPTTFKRWMARGQSDAPENRPYRTFRALVKRAAARAELKHVKNVSDAAKSGVWTASAWWLERRNPRRWGRIDRVKAELTMTNESKVICPQSVQARLADPEVLAAACALAERLAQPKPIDPPPVVIDGGSVDPVTGRPEEPATSR